MNSPGRGRAAKEDYTAQYYVKLTSIATTGGFSNGYIHVYVARELSDVRQHTDEDEFVNVVQMPLKEALHLVNTGEIIDAKTIISLMMAAPHCPIES